MSQEFLEFAKKLAQQAGEILMAHYDEIDGADIQFKSTRELVTKADLLSERKIVSQIQQLYPQHQILAEEESSSPSSSPYRWIIDPLDGTTNYVHSHPFFAVSIALECKGELLVGVVFAPYLEELFYACKGYGAYLNDEPIRVSKADTLIKSILATGFSYHRDNPKYDNTPNLVNLIHKVRGIRRCGSAALDLAYVAAGRYDGFWEIGLQPYDVAAGALIVEEAGGVVSDFENGPDFLFGENIVASNGWIHVDILENLQPFPADEKRT
ncbi:MAG: inositol monophosphatase [Planctomycetota bacterium]|nr:MAG: inositol monophosphatase [Planctomycetota bacterium]